MRYFYTDRLKAEWMAREHGIDWLETTMPEKQINGTRIIWLIDPESHEKLNPQADDIIISRGYVCQAYMKYTRSGEFVVVQPLEQLENSNPVDESYNIIQRHYKAFFMPEVCDLEI